METRRSVQVPGSTEEGETFTIDPVNLTTEVSSPFLPGTNIQYAWDSTSLGYLKTCPRLYQYVMIEGWQGKGENIHLYFGQEYHTALEEYEKHKMAGVNHEDALRQVVHGLLIRTWLPTEDMKCTNGHDRCDGSPVEGCPYCEPIMAPWTVDETSRAGKYKNRTSLIRSVINYLDHYNNPNPDPAETFRLEDGKAAVELSFRFELDWGPAAQTCSDITGRISPEFRRPYLLCGHLDRVVSFNDELFVMDHKTTTTTPGTYFFDQFSPNNQMTLYTLASQVVLDAPIKGVIIDAQQLLVGSDRSVRGFTFRTQGVLDEWLHDLEFWLNQAEAFAEADYWPQNDTSCDKFGGCKFRSICSKDPGVREQFLKASFEQLPKEERWNPLKAR